MLLRTLLLSLAALYQPNGLSCKSNQGLINYALFPWRYRFKCGRDPLLIFNNSKSIYYRTVKNTFASVVKSQSKWESTMTYKTLKTQEELFHSFHSFIFTHAFPIERVAGHALLGGPKTHHGFKKSLIVRQAPRQDGGPSKIGDVITPPGSWSTFGAISRGL